MRSPVSDGGPTETLDSRFGFEGWRVPSVIFLPPLFFPLSGGRVKDNLGVPFSDCPRTYRGMWGVTRKLYTPFFPSSGVDKNIPRVYYGPNDVLGIQGGGVNKSHGSRVNSPAERGSSGRE